MFNLNENKRIYLKYEEIKILGSCDICNKNSSFANKFMNNSLYIIEKAFNYDIVAGTPDLIYKENNLNI